MQITNVVPSLTLSKQPIIKGRYSKQSVAKGGSTKHLNPQYQYCTEVKIKIVSRLVANFKTKMAKFFLKNQVCCNLADGMVFCLFNN